MERKNPERLNKEEMYEERMKMRTSGKAGFGLKPPSKPEIIHSGVQCGVCKQSLTGLRFKCANCVNFDLCDNCNNTKFSQHDPTHVFVKLKKALPQGSNFGGAPLLPKNLYADGQAQEIPRGPIDYPGEVEYD